MSTATCGHKVEHGITTTIKEGSDLSYGTYCAACVIGHHAAGVMENPELEKILAALDPSNVSLLYSFSELSVELDQLRFQLEHAERVLKMVENNALMPHKHEDPQLRLYCLSERALEYFETWGEKDVVNECK